MGTGAHVVQCRCPQHPNRRRRPTVRRRTRFPERLLADAGHFDQLVAELADKAASRRVGSLTPSLGPTFRRFAVHPEDQEVLARTFDTMCRLHDQGRDHIWGYYVRNLARPVWLSQPANRVDVLVGNPPWLSYRFMTTAMQQSFAAMSRERGLWAGAAVATHQDLSGLFVVRCVELYLRDRGRFGFVMPLAALSRRQFAGSGRVTTKRRLSRFESPLTSPGICTKSSRRSFRSHRRWSSVSEPADPQHPSRCLRRHGRGDFPIPTSPGPLQGTCSRRLRQGNG
jgi:hypothetical protein